MPSLQKALRELRRGLTVTRHGGLAVGGRFVRKEILRNSWIRFESARARSPEQAAVECNVCGWYGSRFLTHCAVGYVDRDAFCPRCHSYPRHRGFTWLFRERLDEEVRELEPSDGLRIVFAPEPGMFELLSTALTRLEGADLHPINALVTRREDLQSLAFADRSVDFISCFHVLEHVRDDRRALGELRRVLRPNGRLLLCVPITFGRPETIDFGGPNPLLNDHCFDYGEDFPERVLAAGLSGTSFRLPDVVPEALHRRLRLTRELIFWLRPTREGGTPTIEPGSP